MFCISKLCSVFRFFNYFAKFSSNVVLVPQVSTWESPVKEWENELATRHSVLDRYLLLPQLAKADAKSPDMLQAGG